MLPLESPTNWKEELKGRRKRPTAKNPMPAPLVVVAPAQVDPEVPRKRGKPKGAKNGVRHPRPKDHHLHHTTGAELAFIKNLGTGLYRSKGTFRVQRLTRLEMLKNYKASMKGRKWGPNIDLKTLQEFVDLQIAAEVDKGKR